ncbi:MAG TPA: quinoprotein dehydrogenase-associated putative ABC transporter substrate-binding protein [Thermoanaerobaculia bacterium]
MLRVCADPDNLPYSSSAQTGFENQIATLIAKDWNARVQYTWLPQRRGFARLTLKQGDCDVILGVPSNYEQAATTRPYYRSTYVFVTRRDRHLGITSFDDPQLRRLKIGVQLPSPSAQALNTRGMIDNIAGFPIFDPNHNIVSAVANGEVDLAIVWGPQAAWYARQQHAALELTPVSPQIDLPFLPFVFDISMGVRRGDNALKERLEQELDRRHDDIERILDRYGVPRV